MNYPKLWNGPTPNGESFSRALDGIKAPFLKTIGQELLPDGSFATVTVEKKVGKTDVFRTPPAPPALGSPYLWGEYDHNSDERFYAVRDPAAKIFTNVVFGSQPVGAQSLSSFGLYAGDHYILRLMNDGFNNYFPAIARPTLGDEFLPSAPVEDRTGKSITYAGVAQLTGASEYALSLSSFVAGWQDTTARYVFGFAGLDSTTPPVPRLWTGDTGTQQITERAPPVESGRIHFPFTVYNAGPGRLEYLHAVMDELDYLDPAPLQVMKAQIAPWLASSTDHGATWSRATADFLAPYLKLDEFGATNDYYPYVQDRPSYLTNQLGPMTSGARIIYLGDGKTLMVVPQCWMGEVAGDDTWATLAFLGVAGVYTRIAWPAEDWISTNIAAPSSPAVSTSYSRYFYSAHYAFAPGKAYVPIDAGTPTKVLVTEDYGSSWTLSAALPTGYAIDNAVFGTVVSPGVILFSVPDYTADTLSVVKTADAFLSFTALGTAKAMPDLYNDDLGYGNRFLVYYGGAKRHPYVYPAFPGLFDEPTP